MRLGRLGGAGRRGSAVLVGGPGGQQLQWDPGSGQFSYSQAGEHLARAGRLLAGKQLNRPDSAALLCRTSGNDGLVNLAGVGEGEDGVSSVSCRELGAGAGKVEEQLQESGELQVGNTTLLYLPLGPLAVSTLVACAKAGWSYCPVWAGPGGVAALEPLLATGRVGRLLTSSQWPHLVSRAEDAVATRPGLQLVVLGPGHTPVSRPGPGPGTLDPLFAIYSGGETAVVAGLGELSGFYSVSSSLAARPRPALPPAQTGQPERDFKQSKRNNSFRLEYIDRMLKSD